MTQKESLRCDEFNFNGSFNTLHKSLTKLLYKAEIKMDDNVNIIETLLKSSINYGLAEIKLLKLKTLNKTTDVISGFIPTALVFLVLFLFLLFVSFGLAIWLGQLTGNNLYGFFIIAAFYAITGFLMHLLMRKWMKRKVCDYLVKQIFK